MRKTSIVRAVAILGLIICWGAAGFGQDAAADKPAAKADGEKSVHAYRLDFAVKELEDGKVVNARQYSMNLQADDANEIKIGTRVPVETGEGKQFQYIDVGTNIWCRIGERFDGIPLSVRAEISNFAISEQGSG